MDLPNPNCIADVDRWIEQRESTLGLDIVQDQTRQHSTLPPQDAV